MQALKKRSELILAPLIVLGILFYTFFKSQLFPFGQNVLNWGDMAQQNFPMLVQFRDILLGKQGPFFMMMNAGGMDFTGIFFFLVSSPFSLLCVFFNNDNIIFLINIMIALKLMTCAITASIFFRHFVGNLTSLQNTALSVAYALCGYSMMFYQLHTWLDVMYMFPLLLIAFEKLIKHDKIAPYTITLTLMILFQFYLGYMLALFIIFSFAVYLVFIAPKKDKKKNIVLFAIGTILAVFITSPIILTAFKQYSSSARGVDVLKNLVLGNFFTNLATTVPFILATSFLIIIIPFIFSFKSEIIFYLKVIFILMLIPIIIEPINKMWHTGSYQAFPVRYGYMTVLIGLTLAAVIIGKLNSSEDEKPEKSKPLPILFMSVSLIGFFAFVNWLTAHDSESLKSYTNSLWGNDKSLVTIMLYSSIACIILMLCFVLFYAKKIRKTTFSILLCAFVIVEGVFNTSVYIGFGARGSQGYIKALGLSDKISDDSEYRVKVNNKFLDVNLIGAMGYNSLSHYTSLINEEYIFAMKKLGYSSYWMEVNSNGSTAFMDAFLGNKYTIYNNAYSVQNKNLKYTDGAYYICENESNMSLGNVISKEDVNLLKNIPSENRIGFQQYLYKVLTKSNNNLINEYPYSSVIDVDISKQGNDTVYTRNASYRGFITYDIDVKGRQNLYFDCFKEISARLEEPINGSFNISVNGTMIEWNYPSKPSNGMLDLGEFKDEKVKIGITVLKSGTANSFGVFGVDLDELSQGIKNVQSAEVKVNCDKITAKASANDENSSLLLTIPYSKCFDVKVNGKAVEAYKVLDTFTAIPLEKGENNIEMVYHPFGIKVGLILCAIGILALVLITLYLKKYKYKGNAIIDNILYWAFVALAGAVFIIIYVFPLVAYAVYYF